TDFGLTLTFDWRSHARVFLPITYSGAVCGLCGNANGDPQDDLALPNGDLATEGTHFGDSWEVTKGPGCQAGGTKGSPGCTKEEQRLYGGDKHCGLLVKRRGPLAPCHGVIDPAPYMDDCLFDACVYEGHQEAVCGSISAYVTACQSQGVSIGPWRTAVFCSPICPPHHHYELCGPPCPATCGGHEACEAPSPCAEGCFCDQGLVLSGSRCVPLSQCGCWHHGRYHQQGEVFMVGAPPCGQRCHCQAGGAVQCWPHSCGGDEVCEVQDGRLGCSPLGCGRCEVLGGTFSTFDGRHLSLGSNCTSTAMEVTMEGMEEEPLEAFKVEVAAEGGGIRRVVVTAHGVQVAMEGGAQWEVDGRQHLLPLVLADGALSVSQEGTHRVLLTHGGPKVLFDGSSYVLMSLPSSYQRRPRGLCGDFNGDPRNDEPQGGTSCTPGVLPTACPMEPLGPCGLLQEASGPFAGCHGVVEARKYVVGCVQEQCRAPGGRALCRSFQAYAAACQAAGGDLKAWREEAKCPLSCPPQSHPSLCARSCSLTCAAVSRPPPCSRRCFEGCECDPGFLFHGAQCVPAASCGC
ncbi:FCGBP protein, partial [Probosciger aterrimus]|nr:FCGBP protein [Probosciger aterrimus]